jgi:hypothetical protein
MDTMIHCIIHLPSGPQKALLLVPQPTPEKAKRTRHSTKASRARCNAKRMEPSAFDEHCRKIAREEIINTLKVAEELGL